MKIKKNGKVINLTESDLKRIVKKVLNEELENNVQKSSNVTLTDTFNGLTKEPKVLESNISDDTISFPPNGEPRVGDYGVKPEDSIILPIGGNVYLVIGSIGRLDDNYKVIGAGPMAMVIIAEKFVVGTGDSAGSNVSIFKTFKVNNLPFLTAKISKIRDSSQPYRWLKIYKDNLVKAFKMSSDYGIDTSILNDTELATFDEQTKKYILKT